MEYAFAVRMLGAFAVIAIVLFALQLVARARLAQRLTAGRGRPMVSVLETTFLPNAASLHLVKIAGTYVVIGRSGGAIATLCELTPERVEAWLANQSHAPNLRPAIAGLVARLRRKAPSSLDPLSAPSKDDAGLQFKARKR